MTDVHGLLQELIDADRHASDDDYLVYADLLQSQGDPRGELIVLQHAEHSTPDSSESNVFLDANRDVFVGSLAPAIAHHKEHGHTHGLELSWHLGYIDKAWVGRPDGREKIDQTRELLTVLLAHPSAVLLRELVLDEPIWGRWVDFDPLTEPIAAAGPLPSLRRLQIGDFVERFELADGTTYVDRDISAVQVGNISPLWEALPGLRDIELQGNYLELGDIRAPELRRFVACSSGFADYNLDSVARASWRRLPR